MLYILTSRKDFFYLFSGAMSTILFSFAFLYLNVLYHSNGTQLAIPFMVLVRILSSQKILGHGTHDRRNITK